MVFEDPVAKGGGAAAVFAGEGDEVAGLNLGLVSPVFWEAAFFFWFGGLEGGRGGAYFYLGGGAVGSGWFGLVGFGGGEDEFIKFESVFTHREVDFVKAGFGDIDPDLTEDAGVDFLGALFGVPGPLVLLGPLHFGS
ncbi:MAG: hypothetical protein ACJA16_004919, partial [Akkermansiaceae bacterium]